MPDHRDFKSSILSNGVSRSNRFNVEIDLPDGVSSSLTGSKDSRSNVQELITAIRQLSGRRSDYDRGLNIMCESAVLPDLGFVTTEHIQNSQTRKMPYGVSHDDLALSFIISDDLYEKKIMDLWQNLIYNNQSHSFSYYDDFVSSIKVIKLDIQNNPVYESSFIECYPLNVNVVELSNATSDEFAKLSVVFAYHKWVTEDVEKVNLSFFDRINGIIDNPLSAIDLIPEDTILGKISKDVADFANIFAGDALLVYNKVKNITEKYTGSNPAQVLESVRNIRKSVASANNIGFEERLELENWIKTIEAKIK